ncbi:hypothetical protein L1987_05801 [Smallanthus sonchifolius]|uniref:Uncharacterized protein n=1 Tax=Smallanthus sonchifolius TaxID=185202 RepID=A0ACB9JWL8_9ASTR|nr:hypothetical protein L1987_05801 [Smallanthus sonchifolius]
MASPRTTGLGGFEAPSSKGDALRYDESNLNVGVLHLVPSLEVFPLLADPKTEKEASLAVLPYHLMELDSMSEGADVVLGMLPLARGLMDAMINTQDNLSEKLSSTTLMVVENGYGSPCVDLRQVSSELSAVAKDADLV